MRRESFKVIALLISNGVLLLTNVNATPLLKMQFTNDTVDTAPATATAVQGGVSIKPTSLVTYTDATISVRSSPIDSVTNEMFESSKVAEMNDSSATNGATLRFNGNATDAAGGTAKLRVDLDVMIDSASTRTGNMFVTLKQVDTNTAISSLTINMGSGQITLSNYDAAGTLIDSPEVGYAKIGKSFHLQMKLDYATGAVTVKSDGLLYVSNGALVGAVTKTGTFAKNISFGRLDVSTATTATGKVLLDNISITAITDLPEASVTAYGVNGDGTDETSKIQTALSALGTSIGKLTFESGKTYLIGSALNVSTKKDFTIEGNNSEIKVKDGTPTSGGSGIIFTKCENFTVQNLVVNGNRSGRTPAEAYAHSIILRGSSLFSFSNVTGKNAVCDGFYVSAYTASDAETVSRNGLFLNCKGDNCFRQGMSVINGHHLYVIGGEYTNTNGTAPEAGIDIEANSGTCEPSNMDITVRNSKFSGNAGFGVTVCSLGSSRNITIEDSSFSENDDGGVNLGSEYSLVANNFFEDFSQSVRGIVDIPSTSKFNEHNIVRNNWFKNIQTGHAVIYIHSDSGDYNTIKDNIIRDYNNLDILSFNSTTVISGNLTSLSPAGHWALNEGTGTALTDSSGNNISGVTYNSPSWVAGQYGTALNLNGSNQYALINDNALLDVTDHFTLSAWMYADTDSSTSQHMVIGKSSDFRFGYSGGVSSFGLYAPTAIGRWVCTAVTKGAWHHVAATYNGSRVRLYVDGNLANEEVVKPGSVATDYRVYIGSYSGTTYCFDGTIDDIRIYNVVLSGAAINAVKNNQTP